jgi:hypothetical protein
MSLSLSLNFQKLSFGQSRQGNEGSLKIEFYKLNPKIEYRRGGRFRSIKKFLFFLFPPKKDV